MKLNSEIVTANDSPFVDILTSILATEPIHIDYLNNED